MGKDKNTKAGVATQVDENNLPDLLKDQVADVEVLTSIEDKLKEEQNEENLRLLKNRYRKALYRNGVALLERQRDKQVSDNIVLYKVRQMTRLIRMLVGTKVDAKTLEYAKTPDNIWKKETLSKDGKSIETTLPDGTKKSFKEGESMPPIIDAVDFDMMSNQIEEELRKRREEIEKQYRVDLKKWDLRFGEYYDPSWRW